MQCHSSDMIREISGHGKKKQNVAGIRKFFHLFKDLMADFLYDTKGNKISSGKISVNMWPFDKILQYQFVQEGAKQYVLKLNGAEGYYDEAAFVDLVRDFLGEDAEVVIEHVNEIPVLASGKRKIVVNNYKK